MNREICILDDGQRVGYSLKRRERDPYYLVNFRGPDGKPKERSTKETSKRGASSAATTIIKKAYAPKDAVTKTSWDDAIEKMVRKMKADNLRPGTIEQYEIAVSHLRRIFPQTLGPADITEAMASEFKTVRSEEGVNPVTVEGNIENLSIVYNKWWKKECKFLNHNPFADIAPPKYDKDDLRLVLPAEIQAFQDWLLKRWQGWRFPVLFLEIKAMVGCRIYELAAMPSDRLYDQRLYLESRTTKGRKPRSLKLPEVVYDELKSVAGPKYVFERYSEQLRAIHRKCGHLNHAKCVKEFSPARLKGWLERELNTYFKKNPAAKKFKLHNLRGTAMSKAKQAGIHYEDAAIAFGCNPETMRKHYVVLDEAEITDRVMDVIQGNGDSNGSGGEIESANGKSHRRSK